MFDFNRNQVAHCKSNDDVDLNYLSCADKAALGIELVLNNCVGSSECNHFESAINIFEVISAYRFYESSLLNSNTKQIPISNQKVSESTSVFSNRQLQSSNTVFVKDADSSQKRKKSRTKSDPNHINGVNFFPKQQNLKRQLVLKSKDKLNLIEEELDYEFSANDCTDTISKDGNSHLLEFQNSSLLKNFRVTVQNKQQLTDSQKEANENECFHGYDVTICNSSKLSLNKKDINKLNTNSNFTKYNHTDISSSKILKKASPKTVLKSNLKQNGSTNSFLKASHSSEYKNDQTSLKSLSNHNFNKRKNVNKLEDFNATEDLTLAIEMNNLKDIKRTIQVAPSIKVNNKALKLQKKPIRINKNLSSNTNLLDHRLATDAFVEPLTSKENSQKIKEADNDVLSMILDDPAELQHEDFHLSNLKEDYATKKYNDPLYYNNYSDDNYETSDDDYETSFKRRKRNNYLHNPQKEGLWRNQATNNHTFSKQGTEHLTIKEFNVENCSQNDNSSISSLSSSYDKSSISFASDFKSKDSFCIKTLQPLSKPIDEIQDHNSISEAEILQTGSLDQVLETIKSFCSKDSIQKAISLSDKYISISSSEIRKKILRSLFINIINCFKLSYEEEKVELYDKTFIDILKILDLNNLYDSEVCSTIIFECFSSGLGTFFSSEVLRQCKERNIPIFEKAISAYGDFLNTNEDITRILSFFDYLRDVCNCGLPKKLLLSLFTLCSYNFQNISQFQIKKICDVLCNLDLIDINSGFLEKFFKICIENEHWVQINNIFYAWAKKRLFRLLHSFQRALAYPLEEAGVNFEKFASSVFSSSKNIEKDVAVLFGQIGIFLMFETYAGDKLHSSLNILFVLHQYNIDYLERQLHIHSIYNDPVISNLDYPFDVCIFKETVIHTAIKILLHFERSKDAFDICQGFFEIRYDIENSDLKTRILMERYSVLLKIALQLMSSDPIKRGHEALNIILSIEEQGLKIADVQSKIKSVNRIYSELLTHLLNKGLLPRALGLYEQKYGTFKDQLVIYRAVRRGLVVSCVNNGMIEKAKKIFHVGYLQKCYPIESKPDTLPFSLIIMSSYDIYEIKFAIEIFFEKLYPILLSKEKASAKQKWFAMRIKIKESKEKYVVKCLEDIPREVDLCIQRTKRALQMIDSSLKFEEKEIVERNSLLKCLDIPSSSFYRYWKLTLYSSPAKFNPNKNLVVTSRQHIHFGLNDPEKNAEDYEKIVQFLLTRVLLKHKELSPENQKHKADSLAVYFIRENQVLSKLNKKSMKLLNEFAEKEV